MKNLHLHVGSPKTGTTSIQQVFAHNKKNLNRLGFTYPGTEVNHHFSYLLTKAEQKDWPRHFKSFPKDIFKKNIDNYFSGFERDLKSNCGQQIISTEYLFIDNKSYIKNYVDYLKRYFSKIKVYVFIRNPIDYYRSIQQQKIKGRSYITSPSIFKYDFRSVIEAWSEFCNIEVIEYRSGIDSCKILCDKIDLDYSKLEKKVESSNFSLSIQQMILLEKIQTHFYQNHEDRFKKHLGIIHQINPSFLHKPKLKKWVKPIVYQNHQEDMEWLSKEFNIDFLGDDYSGTVDESLIPTLKNGQALVRDIYIIEDEESVEKYDALVVDALLRKLVKESRN